MTRKLIKIFLLIVALALVFCAGGLFGQATFEPQVIVEHEVVYQIETITETVYRVETEIVEVEKSLRHFDSLFELGEWLAPITIWSGDCEDFALGLQGLALDDGFIVDFEVIYPNEYNKLFKEHKLGVNTVHAINLVIIGNEVYYIEPQTKEIVFVINLD